nr:MAG TPA: hypothetical protein [Caudoviricetes sp.]
MGTCVTHVLFVFLRAFYNLYYGKESFKYE